MAAFLAGEKIDLNIVSESVTFLNAVSQPNGISFFRKQDEGALNTILTMIVAHGCASFNVHTSLSSDQLAEVVSMIKSEYFYFRPEEVALIFKKAKLGEFGKVTFALDISVIMAWFGKYAKDRETYFIGKNTEMQPDTAHANILAYSQDVAIIKDPETGEEREVSKAEIGQDVRAYWDKMKQVKDSARWEDKEFKDFEREYYKNAPVRTDP